ncbi:MAG TPA: DUF2059 domain-containing protein [Acidobacteriaceae bacterium]|nr:DUF2059 domain-containing protein [Acidobacteriaceae bacterium]
MRKTNWLLLIVLTGTVPAWGGATMVRGNGAGPIGESADSAPAHPVTAAQVYEILRLTGTDPTRRQMVDEMLPNLKQMMPYMPDDVVADFQRSLTTADFQGAMIHSFQQHMSREDAAAIIAFYKSPAGQRMIATMPQILNDGQQAGTELGHHVMLQVIQRHRAEIDAAAASYHADHAPSGPAH